MFDINRKVVMVLGAGGGLGRSVIHYLVKQEPEVIIAVSRSCKKLEQCDDVAHMDTMSSGRHNNMILVPLDLQDAAGIYRLEKAVSDNWKHIDLIIYLAGVNLPLIPIVSVDDTTAIKCFADNTYAVWKFIQIMDPLVRKSKSRAMFAVNIRGCAESYQGIYKSSQLAAQCCITSYAKEIEYTGSKIATFDPPTMDGDFRGKTHPGTSEGAISYDRVSEKLLNTIYLDNWINGEHII